MSEKQITQKVATLKATKGVYHHLIEVHVVLSPKWVGSGMEKYERVVEHCQTLVERLTDLGYSIPYIDTDQFFVQFNDTDSQKTMIKILGSVSEIEFPLKIAIVKDLAVFAKKRIAVVYRDRTYRITGVKHQTYFGFKVI